MKYGDPISHDAQVFMINICSEWKSCHAPSGPIAKWVVARLQ